VEERFAECEILVPPASRVGSLGRRVTDSDGQFKPVKTDDPALRAAQETVRDVQQLAFILEQLPPVIDAQVLSDALRRVLKDAEVPVADTAHAVGRDKQCELYVAAICAKAGLRPVLAEPDVVCRADGGDVALAVKRLKSLNKFEDRFQKACQQIAAADMPGFVVVDVSLALNRENLPINIPVPDDDFRTLAQDVMIDLTERKLQAMYEMRQGVGVYGAIFLNHHIRVSEDGVWGLDSMVFVVPLTPHNQRRRREFDVFQQKFKMGLATAPVRSSA
jgi:hypothetical protein